ncbi:hypothetical protein [Kribbella catacumbae]|uniref:hypothetical protein n=1 Tax=Kribbella catacumbae TaxID=460086 RepID=UPI000375453B|nr:hypothetical protein [Kribbella catacumbae]
MKNLDDTLPELMRRATENLEPESTDLVERGMRRGVTLRRRRTALISFSGATAVLATAGIIVSGSQLFGKDAQPPTAGTTTAPATPKANGVAAKPVTQKETLATLLKLLPPHLKVTKTETHGDTFGNGVSLLVSDGKGLSKLSLSVNAPGIEGSCYEPQPGTCLPRPDGSRITVSKEEPTYEPDNNPGGVLRNSVAVHRRGGEAISLMSFNATEEKQTEKTRPKPALSVAELTKIVDSTLWRFPPKQPLPTGGPDKPEPKDPGAGKPGVPVQLTLQTLKNVLPTGLKLTRPETNGGGTNGHNGAAYVINDGKGLSRIIVFVTYEHPVTKCGPEGISNCKVRPDGSVTGWGKNVPEYADARQAKDGVVANKAEIHYPDGRTIAITSYNATAEKGSKHTRVTPPFTPQQLLVMAGNKSWKFPGTGTK